MKLLDDETQAFLLAQHTDVFAYLGMHTDAETGYLTIRCFEPHALEVRLINKKTGKTVSRMEPVEKSGLFVAKTKRKNRFDYFFKIKYDHGEVDVEDVYSFPAVLSELDLYLLAQGKHDGLYNILGAHCRSHAGVDGTSFALWAPHATRVAVVGDFNDWDNRRHVMRKHHDAGYWDIFIPYVMAGANYKFEVRDAKGRVLPLKSDPVGSEAEQRPNTASKVVVHRDYPWQDSDWIKMRGNHCELNQPITIYEVHLGSWRRGDFDRFLNYREIAQELVPYVLELGFTHVQLMPVNEHPFDGSWGYQPVGLFAPTARHGSNEDFKYLIEQLHQAGIGVLIDWVPGHFPSDEHGLARFDGSSLYEYEDPREGFHPDWNTFIYNYVSPQVKNFLRASALHWIDRYHIDGVRVDAVASMLYRNYSRNDGEWIPNYHGGVENLEAIDFLKGFNEELYGKHPGTFSVAEESTAWPNVSKPTDQGGLGFGYKWNMGWMNDTLRYISRDPMHRAHHHDEICFGLVYAFSEQFILPISHDEVVHGKGSMLTKMPGDSWQQFANLRAYYSFMWTHPGKKLLFMGCEFGQGREWNHDAELDWHLLDIDWHQGVKTLIADLNQMYQKTPALYELDCSQDGFEWIDGSNAKQSIYAYCRYGVNRDKPVLVICNFTPATYDNYQLGVPLAGQWREIFNSDGKQYQGSGMSNDKPIKSKANSVHGREHSITLRIPPLATVVLELA